MPRRSPLPLAEMMIRPRRSPVARCATIVDVLGRVTVYRSCTRSVWSAQRMNPFAFVSGTVYDRAVAQPATATSAAIEAAIRNARRAIGRPSATA